MSNAIINSGNRRLICECPTSYSVPSFSGVTTKEVKPGDVVTVTNAYELRCQSFLIPTPEGPILMHQNMVVPVDSEEESVEMEVKIDNIRWFKSMKDQGRKYNLLIEEFEERIMAARAESAGIAMAKRRPPTKSNIIL
jgi:DNA replicative helicase MCM subunit Mcm2 (Cdc46/Mcm family)